MGFYGCRFCRMTLWGTGTFSVLLSLCNLCCCPLAIFPSVFNWLELFEGLGVNRAEMADFSGNPQEEEEILDGKGKEGG